MKRWRYLNSRGILNEVLKRFSARPLVEALYDCIFPNTLHQQVGRMHARTRALSERRGSLGGRAVFSTSGVREVFGWEGLTASEEVRDERESESMWRSVPMCLCGGVTSSLEPPPLPLCSVRRDAQDDISPYSDTQTPTIWYWRVLIAHLYANPVNICYTQMNKYLFKCKS